MAITVTTRSGKGSPLTTVEMDTNLTDLARDARIDQQGNVRLATQAEVDTGTADELAVAPNTLATRLSALVGTGVSVVDHGGGQGTITLDSIIIKYGVTPAIVGGTGPGTGTPGTVTYPTAFPTATLRVIATMNAALDDTTTAGVVSVDNFLPASFRMNLGENPASGNPTFNYIAIGN